MHERSLVGRLCDPPNRNSETKNNVVWLEVDEGNFRADWQVDECRQIESIDVIRLTLADLSPNDQDIVVRREAEQSVIARRNDRVTDSPCVTSTWQISLLETSCPRSSVV